MTEQDIVRLSAERRTTQQLLMSFLILLWWEEYNDLLVETQQLDWKMQTYGYKWDGEMYVIERGNYE